MTGAPIALTAGDAAGVGPELLVRLLAELHDGSAAEVVVVSDHAELQRGLDHSGLGMTVDDLLAPAGVSLDQLDGPLPEIGSASADAGRRALAGLDRALALREQGTVGGLVFAPLNKRSLHLAGMVEPDELRWFEERIGGGASVSEVNVSERFWTARVTSHVALREVADLITAERVEAATVLLHGLLVDAGVAAPRIAVCALNPHAGERGLFGDEEARVIQPGVDLARDRGIDATGPFPCDTLFIRGFDGTYDGIVTMYHDQGQIALKTRSFDGGVTLEAGLGMPICTPAHGTAFDIVGTGSASLASMRNAYRLTERLVAAAA
jgi:4-hydroxythreonine-4-phosphate dehydrogenase